MSVVILPFYWLMVEYLIHYIILMIIQGDWHMLIFPNERTYSFGKINMSSGNILLKIFRYNTKVEIITQEENIVICDSTKYCSNQLITMFFLVLIILCIVITGVVYQIRIRQGVRQNKTGDGSVS